MARGIGPWVPEQLATVAPAVALLAAPRGGDLRHEAATVLSALLREFRYVVVDEIVDEHALLVASEWPQVDDEDRRLFPDRDEDDRDGTPAAGPPAYEEVGVDLPALQRLLDDFRLGNGEEQHREVRIGDVFAMTPAALTHLAASPAAGGHPQTEAMDESDLVVVDVTRSARGAAKAAFSRVVAAAGGSEPETPPEFAPPDPPPGPPDPQVAALRDVADRAQAGLPDETAALADRQAGSYAGERPDEALQHLVTDLEPPEADTEARELIARIREAVSDPRLPEARMGRVLRQAARLLQDPRAVTLAAAAIALLRSRVGADDREGS